MTIVNVPPTKNSNQRSLDVSDAYLARFIPAWNMPPTLDANAWRNVVNAQPIATSCRDTLISSILSLDWKITVRDSDLQDEMAGTIKYYTRLFDNSGGSGLDYSSHVEWICGDLLDTPFGGMSEIGRDGDKPNGRVRWIEPLDAATLYPTLNKDFPVIQMYNGNQVAFPTYAMARAMMNPRTRIEYKGWGVAPPEKAYLALNMMSRGDVYYANLLLDIPTTGILDLGDMEKESALEWVDAYKTLLSNGGNGSFKIPVLYEHQNAIKFVPFGKVPNDIMFDRITLRYAALIAAAYGMTLSDIGIQSTSSGGETLAGSIRSERKTRKTGFARMKKKLKYYFEQILPPTLQFAWIDYDDEVNVALGRARLANATAFKTLTDAGSFSLKEVRQQMIADGMFTISMPEEIPTDAKPKPVSVPKPAVSVPDTLGKPVPVSLGGHGEIKKYVVTPDDLKTRAVVAQILELTYDDLVAVRNETSVDDLPIVRSTISKAISDGSLSDSLHGVTDGWLDTVDVEDRHYLDDIDELLKKSILMTLKEVILTDEALDFTDADVYDTLLDAVTTRLGDEFDNIVATAVQTSLGE